MEVIADTCWFIDLEKQRSEAIEFLRQNSSATFVLTEVVRAELYAGGRDISRVAALVGAADLLSIDDRVAKAWGDSARGLRSSGQMIGANDLWIASISLVYQVPVLTRNPSDFSRVPGVQVVHY